MANVSAPFGFSQYQGTGSLPTYEQTQLAIISTSTTPIYLGDPVCQSGSATTGIPNGYIQQAVAPYTVTVTGVAYATGVATFTFSALTTAPLVGSSVALTGFTSTGATISGIYVIQTASTTTFTCNMPQNGVWVASGTATIYTPIAGIFVGCRYLSVAQKRPVWQNYWNGSDANGDVTAYVITDPNAQFVVQTANSATTATPVGFTNVGNNIGFALGTGTAANGLSGAYADQNTLTSGLANPLLPFRIIALANYVPGAISPLASINGNDSTTAFNRIVVGFNNAQPRAFVGM